MDLHFFSAFSSPLTSQSALQYSPHSPVHAHIRTLMREAAMQGGNLLIRSNLGLSVLLKDTLTCSRRTFPLQEKLFVLLPFCFFPPFIQHIKGSRECKISWRLKKVKVCTYRRSSVPQKTLLLKRLVSSPAFTSVTLWHHNASTCHTFA